MWKERESLSSKTQTPSECVVQGLDEAVDCVVRECLHSLSLVELPQHNGDSELRKISVSFHGNASP